MDPKPKGRKKMLRLSGVWMWVVGATLTFILLQLYLYYNLQGGPVEADKTSPDWLPRNHINNHAAQMEIIQPMFAEFNHSIPCPNMSKHAESAIQRAHSKECQNIIMKTSCANEADMLYPIKLKSLCPANVDERNRRHYLGCFKDSFHSPLLQGAYFKLKAGYVVNECNELCLKIGFTYAGVKHRIQCFCGKDK